MKSDRSLYVFRRTMGVILALAFSLTTVPLWTVPAEIFSVYAAEEQTGVEYAGQTEEGVYTISTLEQLETLADKVNDGFDYEGSTFKLVAEIDLSEKYNKDNYKSWTPIGVGKKCPFSGKFDGGKENGYQITGLYMDVDADLLLEYWSASFPCFGLFGYVDGEIKNLRVKGDISTEGVAGKDELGNHVGGIVGYNIGTVKECEYDGTITTGYDVESIGGIAGYNGEGSTIENCTNNGDIEITDADGSKQSWRIGGIVGTNNGTVVECRNTGSITSDIKEASAKIQMSGIGGIAGYAGKGSIIENCRNTGDINIKAIYPGSSVNGIGGIVGGITAEVKNCTNEGNITVEFEGVGESKNIGGISGSISDWGDDFIKVTGCTNTGEIKAENGRNVGGISASLGMDDISGTMTDCINQGTVQGSKNIGGIVGDMENAEVIKCYNIGAVSGNDDTGGVVGSMKSAEVIKCYNIGTVSGNNDAGGVVGYLYDENVTVQSCYYLDTCGAAGEGTSATKTQFNSGEIAYLLQEDWSGQVWGQQLTGSKNSYPILTDKPEEKVLEVIFYIDDTEYDTGYANPNGAVEIFPDDPERDGYLFCKWTADGRITGDELANHVNTDGATVYATWQYLAPDEVRAEITETTVTITYPTGDDYEYALDDGEWQDSPEFDGLTSGSHTVHARRKGTDEIAPSESTSTTVTVGQQGETTPAESETTPSGGGSTGTTGRPSGGGAVIVPSNTSDTETVTVTVENKVTGDIRNLTATRDGDTVTVNLGKENDGLYANVYDTNSGDFVTAALIEDGKAVFTLAKGIKFNIVIDSFAHGDDVSADSGIYAVSDVVETAVPVIGFIVPAAVSLTMILKLKKKKSVK